MMPEHGTMIYTVDGLVGQVIGIPSPQGLIPVIPKYVSCSGGEWLRPGGRFCRVIPHYGPEGLELGIRGSGLIERFDPQYGSPMPYVSEYSVLLRTPPREALARVLRGPAGPLHEKAVLVAELLGSCGISLGDLGLTGSVAAGIQREGVSDLDFVVYGSPAAVSMAECFSSIAGAGAGGFRGEFGGVTVDPPVNTSWRKGIVGGQRVTWVGVRTGPGECPPLSSYEKLSPPLEPVEARLRVPEGQGGALTYPPCVESSEGVYLISYEYNLAAVLYKGGRLEVSGTISADGRAIYVGLRARPGRVASARA